MEAASRRFSVKSGRIEQCAFSEDRVCEWEAHAQFYQTQTRPGYHACYCRFQAPSENNHIRRLRANNTDMYYYLLNFILQMTVNYIRPVLNVCIYSTDIVKLFV